MEEAKLSKQFANRLREAMLAAGLHSARSPSGVSIHALAEITGYSLQICRKYLRGEAIPEPNKLMIIASKLSVSPGWLLFGDAQSKALLSEQSLCISKNVLHYIFTKASGLYNNAVAQGEVPDFLMALVSDLSLIDASEDQSKKIIDLALSSVNYFSH